MRHAAVRHGRAGPHSQGDNDDALHRHGLDRMLHQHPAARIAEAGGKLLGQPDRRAGPGRTAARRHPRYRSNIA
jgi:hypothetical protein